MTQLDRQRVRRYLALHAPLYETATELAEGAAYTLDLTEELDDPASELWALALRYFREAAP